MTTRRPIRWLLLPSLLLFASVGEAQDSGRWPGSYNTSFRTTNNTNWIPGAKLQISAKGARFGDKVLKAAKFDGDTLRWSEKSGNPVSCEITFKAKDGNLLYWKKPQAKASFTGWIQVKGEKVWAFRGKLDTKKTAVATPPVVVKPVKPVKALTPNFIMPAAFAGRVSKASLKKEGGSKESEAVVKRGLDWLAKHQSADGRWDTDGWRDNCKKGRCDGPGVNNGDSRYDVGHTGLALLAFLGAGNTTKSGKYKATIKKALTYLLRKQRADGSIGFGEGEEIYNHAIATTAFCEAYGMIGSKDLKKAAEKAIGFCLKAQNPALGWQYGIKPGRNDTSITGWMVGALMAAKRAKLKVDASALAGAHNWFKRATDAKGEAGYNRPGSGSSYIPATDGKYELVPCMTAVAIVSRIHIGETRSNAQILGGVKLLLANSPERSSKKKTRKTNFYYWYYGTNAMFQIGGKSWTAWNEKLQKAVLPYARLGGCEDGSIDPVGEWCISGGRVYSTAITVLTLQTYYRGERTAEGK
ncbi:MAG: terpene cyclase/mutase family protein [Planctomycetota bacterium]|nr:terpene cyclase/mutase family protein [Planctomycetota bacterium]